MTEAFFDTTVLIDALNRWPQAPAELKRYDRHLISRVVWIEVLAGTKPENRDGTLEFLKRFETIELDAEIGQLAADFRQRTRVKLPDAVIWATAHRHSILLVTRNSKDFPATMPGIRIPYIIESKA